MTSSLLTEQERAFLLQFARKTIEHAVRNEAMDTPLTPPHSARLQAQGASFVTLHMRNGALRGCIGSLIAHRSLLEDVRENAIAAAFRDPRFSPLQLHELDNIVMEVSVLTEPEPLGFEGPDDLIRKLRPNVDGVLIERDWNRATFLPQVWEQLPTHEEFLSHLCSKAGLPLNAWRWPDLKVSTYQVEKFGEEDSA